MTEAVRPNSITFYSVTFPPAKKNKKISASEGFHNVAKA